MVGQFFSVHESVKVPPVYVPASVTCHLFQNVHLVMDLCRGGDLFDRIVSNGRLPEKTAAKLCYALVGALLHCHHLGIVHRDIKPENVLLVDAMSEDKIKLVDFGVAAFFEPGNIKPTEAHPHTHIPTFPQHLYEVPVLISQYCLRQHFVFCPILPVV